MIACGLVSEERQADFPNKRLSRITWRCISWVRTPSSNQPPDFMVVEPSGEDIALADYRCKLANLAFYPADRGPVCGDQVVLLFEVRLMFEELNGQMLGFSLDGRRSHHAFADDRNLNSPLLSGFESKVKSPSNMVSMILKPVVASGQRCPGGHSVELHLSTRHQSGS